MMVMPSIWSITGDDDDDDNIYIMMKCMYVCHMFAYFLSEGRHVHSDDDDENGHDNYDKD